MIAAERPSDPRSVVVSPPRRWAATPGLGPGRGRRDRPVARARDAPGPPGRPRGRAARPPPRTTRPRRGRRGLRGPARRGGRRPGRGSSASPRRWPTPRRSSPRYEPALLTAQSTAWRGKGRAAGRAYTAAPDRRREQGRHAPYGCCHAARSRCPAGPASSRWRSRTPSTRTCACACAWCPPRRSGCAARPRTS